MNTVIRPAGPEDAARISGIYARSWKAAYRGIIPQEYLDTLPTDYWEPKFTEWLTDRSLRADLLFCGDAPAGAVAYGKSRDDRYPDFAEVVSLYVVPEQFRKGCGTSLLRGALQNLRGEGYRDCYLWVMRENERAQEFYWKMGFAPTADTCSYPIAGKVIVDVRYVVRL